MPPITSKKKLIVLCDGSWCGSETNTQSNIYLLAKMIGIDMFLQRPDVAKPIEYENTKRGVKACYFPGCGLGGTFLEYLFNGATGCDMGKDCTDTYKYIARHYSEDYEIWMFGLSRGCYTVRCVGGMINNCGIIKRQNASGDLDDATLDSLCDEVYKIYRSPYEEDNPKSESTLEFKRHASYDVDTPIKFMGLLDTVGSLGVPKLDAGIGLDYPEFYDQKISSVVEKVYHACSIHDRLWCFEPCRALRDADTQKGRPDLEIHERWFPGCHYDLGRQRFRFLRNGANFLEAAVSRVLGPLANVIEPNNVLADLVLKWMLESVKVHDPESKVIQGIDAEIAKLLKSIKSATHAKAGTGDVYGNVLDFGPAGKVFHVINAASSGLISYLDKLVPGARPGTAIQDFFGVKLIINALAATRDRRIPDSNAVLTLYKSGSSELGDKTIQDLSWIDPTQPMRYPSKTFENFKIYLLAMDKTVSAASVPS
jgi:hypothetical protein